MSDATTTAPVPTLADMMLDSSGRYVPRANVRPEHILEDEMVRELVAEAADLSTRLRAFRERCFERARAHQAVLEQEYGASKGGKKGNVTFTSYDGSMRMQIAVGEHLAFGPELQVAKKLVDQCINEWSKGADDNLRTIVNDAFQVDKEGRVQVDRILALRRLAINHPVWKQAMEAISNGLKVIGSKEYVRFHRRSSPDADAVLLPLDIARV